jgi:hypothetical protein
VSLLVERLETLPLLHAGMQRDDVDLEQRQQRMQSTDAVDGGEEDDRASGVAHEEVVEVNVLRKRDQVRTSMAEWCSSTSGLRTFSCCRHSILHSLSVSTRPCSGDKSMISGSGSRKSDEFARPALALQVQLKLLRHGGGEDERSHVGSHRQRVCIRARRNDIVKVVDVGVLALCPEEAGAAGSAWEKKLAARRELKGGELTCCDASI